MPFRKKIEEPNKTEIVKELQEYNDSIDNVINKELKEFNEISLLLVKAENEDEFFDLKDDLISMHERLRDSLEAKYTNNRYLKIFKQF